MNLPQLGKLVRHKVYRLSKGAAYHEAHLQRKIDHLQVLRVIAEVQAWAARY